MDMATGTFKHTTFADFFKDLKADCEDPNARRTAERKLMELKQNNKDCASYYTTFTTYAILLSLEDQTKIGFFRRGLNKEVQTALAYNIDIPTDFGKFGRLCIQLDNNMRCLGLHNYPRNPTTTYAQKTATTSTTVTNKTRTSTGTHAGPMEI